MAWHDGLTAWQDQSFSRRIAVAALSVGLAGLLVIGALSFAVTATVVAANNRVRVSHLADLSAQRMSLALEEWSRDAWSVADSRTLRQAGRAGGDSWRAALAEEASHAATHGLHIRLIALSRNSGGTGVVSPGATGAEDWLKAAAAGSAVVAHLGGTAGHRRLEQVFPLRQDGTTGEVKGLLLVETGLDTLLWPGGEAVDSGLVEVLEDAQGRALARRGANTDGRPAVTATRRLDLGGALAALGLQVVVSEDAATGMSPLWTMAEAYAAIALLASVLMAGGAMILGRRLADPLRHLAQVAAGIAPPDAAALADEPAPSDEAARSLARQDEVGRLARSITGLLAQLEASRRMLERRVEERTRALSEAQDRLSGVLASVLDIVWSAEPDSGRMVFVSAAAERLTGRPAAEFLADPFAFAGIVHPEDEGVLLNNLLGAGPAMEREWTFRIKRPDGAVRWVESRCRLVRADDGGLVRLDGITTDITERHDSRAQLDDLMESLRRSNAELQQFAYVVSHDLQEPLRMVASYVQLLQRRYQGQLDERADQFIHFAVDGAQRMQRMILDLLDYSRVSTRDQTMEPVEMAPVLDDALANLRAAIAETGAEIVLPARFPQVQGNRSQLVRLMQNLIGNALKYRHPERTPRLSIAVEARGRGFRFSVHDNGIGIEPEAFERIFQVFQRLHGRDQYSGTGIGLAICKKIVERHGGQIWVESIPGESSTFFFTLPAPP